MKIMLIVYLSLKIIILIFNDVRTMIYISVIIPAYNRKKYLKGALNSVIEQDLSTELFEVIVVKNFYDYDLDTLINNNNFVNIYSNETSYIKFILKAAEKAKGDIISFLEDDDLYLRERLTFTYNAFISNSNLGFLKTNFAMFSEQGEERNNIWKEIKDPILVKGKENNLQTNLKIHQYGIDAVISASAIRKTLLTVESKISELYHFDYFLPYITLKNGYDILATDKVLTKYRLAESWTHASTSNYKEFVKKKSDLLVNTIQSYEIIKSILNEKNFNRALDYQITEMKLELSITGDKSIDIPFILNYLRRSLMERNFKRIIFLLVSFLGKLNKKAIKKLFVNYSEVRY